MLRVLIARRLGEHLELEDPIGPGFREEIEEGRIRLVSPIDPNVRVEVALTGG